MFAIKYKKNTKNNDLSHINTNCIKTFNILLPFSNFYLNILIISIDQQAKKVNKYKKQRSEGNQNI